MLDKLATHMCVDVLPLIICLPVICCLIHAAISCCEQLSSAPSNDFKCSIVFLSSFVIISSINFMAIPGEVTSSRLSWANSSSFRTRLSHRSRKSFDPQHSIPDTMAANNGLKFSFIRNKNWLFSIQPAKKKQNTGTDNFNLLFIYTLLAAEFANQRPLSTKLIAGRITLHGWILLPEIPEWVFQRK